MLMQRHEVGAAVGRLGGLLDRRLRVERDPDREPVLARRAIDARRVVDASTWKVTLSPPASAICWKWCAGSSTIRWQSTRPPSVVDRAARSTAARSARS